MGRIKNVSAGALLLVLLNIAMALGSIWIFARMSPAIDKIIEENGRSLIACEQMISLIALEPELSKETFSQEFSVSYQQAMDNVSEEDELEVLARIKSSKDLFLAGKKGARVQLVSAIRDLSGVNHRAMLAADAKAGQLGSAGAWGVVFMALLIFFVGLLLLRAIRRSLLQPIAEVSEVLTSHRSGDKMRRCTGHDLPRDIDYLYKSVNELLDRAIR